MNKENNTHPVPSGILTADQIKSEIENFKKNKSLPTNEEHVSKTSPTTAKGSPKKAQEESSFDELLEDSEVFVEEDFTQAESILVCAAALGLMSLLTPGNLSVIAGKPKSGKTTLIAILIVATYKSFGNLKGQLSQKRNKIIYVDCEAGSRRTQALAKLVCKLLNVETLPCNIKFYSIRKHSAATRLSMIEFLGYRNPDLAVIYLDGFRDLIMSINDFFEVGELMEKLLRMVETTNIHLSGVLHFNKGDRNTRGVVGSEMNNKAELVITIDKKIDKGETTFQVKPDLSRDLEFTPFAFRRTENSIEIIDDWKPAEKKSSISLEELTDEQHKAILSEVFANTSEFPYGEIVDAVLSSANAQLGNFSIARAKKLVTMYYERKLLRSRKEGARTLYRLAD